MDSGSSRVSSVLEAVQRLRLTDRVKGAGAITIHVLGMTPKRSEGVEYSGLDHLLLQYEPLLRYLETEGAKELNFGFIGPSLGVYGSQSSWSRICKGIEVTVFVNSAYYHDFHKGVTTTAPANHTMLLVPDILVMFNPGLWGYESWIPTLHCLKDFRGSFVMVTAFTIEEAEDDSDTIETVFNDINSLEWCWEIEVNPWASNTRLERACAVEGRHYYDNYAWQCFQIK